jgi:hypothetical protein
VLGGCWVGVTGGGVSVGWASPADGLVLGGCWVGVTGGGVSVGWPSPVDGLVLGEHHRRLD